jgi:hypothetical protein
MEFRLVRRLACNFDEKGWAMKTHLVFSALLLAASMGYCQSSNNCPNGQYPSPDGRCVADQTGDQYPVGDGCNVATCMDRECQSASISTYICSTPAQKAAKAKHPALNLNLSGHFSAVNVTIYPNGEKMMEGLDKDGKVVFTVFRDGRIVVVPAEKK